MKEQREGYQPTVWFTVLLDFPNDIRVRSANWKCEYEPNGVYNIDDCRKFYRSLIKAGFVRS